MADVFLSYAKADRARAERVATALTRAGWSVWWDPELVPGDRFRDEIAAQLGAAKCVVVLWSTASERPGSFVKEEADEGKSRGVLVQALIEAVRPPLGFREFQFADLTDWDGWNEHPGVTALCTGIARHVWPSGPRATERDYPVPPIIQGPSGSGPVAPAPNLRAVRMTVLLTLAILALLATVLVWLW